MMLIDSLNPLQPSVAFLLQPGAAFLLQPGVAFLYPWKLQKTFRFFALGFSIPPENIKKPLGFFIFSGGIEKQHRAVTG